MRAEYLYLAFAALLVRGLLGMDESPATYRRLALSICAQLLALAVMEMTPALALLAAALVAVSVGAFALERRESVRNLVRFAASVLLLAGLSFIGPSQGSAVRFADWTTRWAAAVSGASVVLVRVDEQALAAALAVLAGALFVTVEINHLTRWILLRLKVTPARTGRAKGRGEAELRRGKVIGIAERLLIFYFVLTANLSAIGFVLAAKGFTRFRELDNRDFAEYVLIGTLVSALGAILVGLVTGTVLQAL
jgi:hypothetical protein